MIRKDEKNMDETNKKKPAKPSARSVFSENLMNKQPALGMRIAREAVKRSKLAQDKLSLREDTYVYKRFF